MKSRFIHLMPNPAHLRTFALTLFSLSAFASNSLLCRIALRSAPGSDPAIDPVAFTGIRLFAGALILGILFALRRSWKPESFPAQRMDGNWHSALALFLYAAAFSFAYVRLTTGTGALILFGSVQATMIGWGLFRGANPRSNEWIGLGLALFGLTFLAAPGVSSPDPLGALLMTLAGISWGVYSMRGKGSRDPLAATAGNFLLSLTFVLPPAFAIAAFSKSSWPHSGLGIGLAMASGALASGIGYSVWYLALRGLTSTRAAVVQLGVPVLAATGGVLFLGEHFTTRLVLSGAVILTGISLVVLPRHP